MDFAVVLDVKKLTTNLLCLAFWSTTLSCAVDVMQDQEPCENGLCDARDNVQFVAIHVDSLADQWIAQQYPDEPRLSAGRYRMAAIHEMIRDSEPLAVGYGYKFGSTAEEAGGTQALQRAFSDADFPIFVDDKTQSPSLLASGVQLAHTVRAVQTIYADWDHYGDLPLTVGGVTPITTSMAVQTYQMGLGLTDQEISEQLACTKTAGQTPDGEIVDVLWSFEHADLEELEVDDDLLDQLGRFEAIKAAPTEERVSRVLASELLNGSSVIPPNAVVFVSSEALLSTELESPEMSHRNLETPGASASAAIAKRLYLERCD